MPELPEVETIRRAIEPAIVGTQITDIELPDPAIAGPDGPEHLREAIGSPVRAVLRRGKHLILVLERNRGVVLHLRMTGALLLDEPPPRARVRAVLRFSNALSMLKHVSWLESCVFWCAQTELCWNPKMCRISAFTYQLFAKKRAALNPVNYAKKPLKP